MSDQFVAEIRIFGFNFAPTQWALCNGQLLPISQNTALFSLLGTNFGGDGRTNFGLPNLQGSVPVGQGQGPGLSFYGVGQSSGSQNVTLLQSEMPAHAHTVQTNVRSAESNTPGAQTFARAENNAYVTVPPTPNVSLSPQAIGVAGSSLPHNNMQPYLTMNFCIALAGIFPPRS
jgi:microcystin-dependent protein